jgi:hypothetical protein
MKPFALAGHVSAMRLTIILTIGLLSACGREGTGPEPRRAAVQTANLTGLYEGAAMAGERSQLCMVPHDTGDTAFGIVVRAPGGGVCSGAGEAVREGDSVQLTMAGDEQCVIAATADGTRLTLADNGSPGCRYYCSRKASFAGEAFEKTGGTAEDAMRATDLVGDPLCD